MTEIKTKSDIISGFSGAEKTTIIRKLIAEEYKNEKVVVLGNEFDYLPHEEELQLETRHLGLVQSYDHSLL